VEATRLRACMKAEGTCSDEIALCGRTVVAASQALCARQALCAWQASAVRQWRMAVERTLHAGSVCVASAVMSPRGARCMQALVAWNGAGA
jgi:hypothetical protein